MIGAGTSVDGYRVARMIGRGGMGEVYEAVQTSIKRRVALKVLRPELAEDPEFVERFRREARLQASIEHPHVLEVYEVGESEQGLFLAMRLVSGRTLLDLLRHGELDAGRALELLDQVTGALDAAHHATLVHRDVKPQNVLVDEGDRAFLADFGLTRGAGETTVGASRPMLGTVAYVAPEVVRGEEPTPASDRYSLAATLFHCLTGDVVFPRGSDAAVLYAHVTEHPPRVRDRRRELPEHLDAVLEPALAKQPDERPPTAQAIVRAARDALGPRLARLGSPRIADPLAQPASAVAPPGPAPRKPVAARVPVWIGLLLAGAAIGTAAGALLLGGDNAGDQARLPPVTAGAEALGSGLAAPQRSIGCDGEPPNPSSPSCSIVQSELPGGTVLVPDDGVIVGWSVRRARGDLAIDVIRPRGSDTARVGRSQWEFAGNPGPHRFETRLPVEAGDQIGLELGPGASIGVSATGGATTQRWLEPVGGAYGRPDMGEGTGLDYELALRTELVPGKTVGLPRHLIGAAAANAPDGRVRDHAPLEVDQPRKTRLRVELVEVDGRVALDVSEAERRTLRVFIPDLEPGGIPAKLKTFAYPGESFGEADVWWVNPNTGRLTFHYLIVGDGSLESAG